MQFEELDINWENYLEKLDLIYEFYIENIHNKLYFLDKPVICREKPEFDGKVECFWHIITEDLKHEKKSRISMHNKENNKTLQERIPDIERCKRINLIPFILNNYDNSKIKCWEKIENTRRGSQNRIYLWLQECSYIVILGDNKTNFQLITAYYINYKHTEQKLIKESKIYNDPR